VEHVLDDLVRRLRSGGLSLETYLRSQEKDEAALRADLRPAAERRVRTRILLDEVAKHEALTLTEEEISAAIENLAEEAHEDPGKLKARLAQGEGLAGLREHLLRQKAMTMLVASASGAQAAGGAPTAAPGAPVETPGESAR